MLLRQKLIKKINQKLFAGFFAKKFFKTKVGVGIEVFANHGLLLIAVKDVLNYTTQSPPPFTKAG